LVTTFADADAFAAYVDHPRHRAIVSELLKPTCESWLTLQAEAWAEFAAQRVIPESSADPSPAARGIRLRAARRHISYFTGREGESS
jgi:stress responsive alpha/beta barrel protein